MKAKVLANIIALKRKRVVQPVAAWGQRRLNPIPIQSFGGEVGGESFIL